MNVADGGGSPGGTPPPERTKTAFVDTIMPGPPPPGRGTGPFHAVLSVRFKVYDVPATGSCKNTRCGASAADRLPIAGNGASCRVRPWESRAVEPLLLC